MHKVRSIEDNAVTLCACVKGGVLYCTVKFGGLEGLKRKEEINKRITQQRDSSLRKRQLLLKVKERER